MQTMTETLQKLIGKPLVESTDQEIYLALLDLVRSKSAAQVRPVNGRKLYYIPMILRRTRRRKNC